MRRVEQLTKPRRAARSHRRLKYLGHQLHHLYHKNSSTSARLVPANKNATVRASVPPSLSSSAHSRRPRKRKTSIVPRDAPIDLYRDRSFVLGRPRGQRRCGHPSSQGYRYSRKASMLLGRFLVPSRPGKRNGQVDRSVTTRFSCLAGPWKWTRKGIGLRP